MNDEQLRAVYLRMLATHSPRRDCPAPDSLLAILRHEGPETTRIEMFDHVASCAGCLRDLDLLRTLLEAERREQRLLRGGRWRTGVPLAIAAGLVIAISLSPQLRRSQGESDTPRGAARAVALHAPGDGASVAAPAITFIWQPVPAARRYTLEVVTREGATALRTETRDTTVAAGRALAAGEYRWWVRAHADDGSERRSAARLLRVRTP